MNRRTCRGRLATVSPLTPALSPLRGEGVAMHPRYKWVSVSRARYVCTIEPTRQPGAENAFVMVGTSVALPLPSTGRGPG